MALRRNKIETPKDAPDIVLAREDEIDVAFRPMIAVAKKMPLPKTTNEQKIMIAAEVCSDMVKYPHQQIGTILKLKPYYPNYGTWKDWVNKVPEIAQSYHHAQELQAGTLMEESIRIADDGTNDYKEGKFGGPMLNTEAVKRSEMRINLRTKIAAMKAPHLYSPASTAASTNIHITMPMTTEAMTQKAMDLSKSLREKLGVFDTEFIDGRQKLPAK